LKASRYRHSRYRESRGQEIGNLHGKGPGKDQIRPFEGTHGRDLKRVEDRRFGSTVDKKSLQFGIAKYETPTRRRKCHRGGQLSVYRRIGDRHFVNPEDEAPETFEVVKSVRGDQDRPSR
jgi:hypothetical protein